MADGSPLGSGPVLRETLPLNVSINNSHFELMCFDVVSSPLFPVIIGLPWLKVHNPLIDWSQGSLSFSSPFCRRNCLRKHSSMFPQAVACTTEEKSKLLSLVPVVYHEFLDIFNERQADILPPHRPYDCPIDLLPGAPIPFGRIYPLAERELTVLQEYIEENLRKGFIRHPTSPAGAGIFFVEKKDHSLRPCIDYRDLNKSTIKNRYPLPLIHELFQRLRSATIFSKLDLKGAYNLIRVREGDEWKTAFRTRYGHYEYLVMPFGLCNAPATFQHFINDIFCDILDVFVVAYLDDILVYSTSLEEHRKHMKEVFSRLRLHNLVVKAEKCEFERDNIEFLGFVISTKGIVMDSKKVSAILDWPTPKDRKAVQRFVGFANFYRKFIRNFSEVIRPITDLTKQKVKFNWSPQAQRAFDKLKENFTSVPILAHPVPSQPFTLEVDASECAVGAVLSQRSVPQGLLHPVAFFSRKLSKTEQNYDVADRELLAIKLALEEWRHLLEGAAHPILVLTDHKNLEYLRSAKRLRPRQARWALFFSRFQLHITYRPGSRNTKADALSRMYSSDASFVTDPAPILQPSSFLLMQPSLLHKIRQHYNSDVADTMLNLQDGFYFFKNRLFVPVEARLDALKSVHDSPLAGHLGLRKTLDLLRRHFWWPKLGSDCARFVRSCEVCAKCKGTTSKPLGLLYPLPVPDRPWVSISMDFITDLPASEGFSAILVVVDRLTKLAHFIPLSGVPSASILAKVFIKEIVRLHGLPEDIISDRGVQFTSKFWRALCKGLQICLSFSSGYHPQTNGQTERTNQTLEQYLRCFSCFLQDNWASLLAMAEFAYNNSIHASTKQTPFFSNLGFHPIMIPGIPQDVSVPAAQDRLTFLASNLTTLHQNLLKAQSNFKFFADKKRNPDPEFEVGDMVWLSTLNLRLTCPSKKLAQRFIGPFEILQRINPVSFKLLLPRTLRIHPVFHAAPLKRFVPSQFPGRGPLLPDPVVISDHDEYEVESIVDSKSRRGEVQYLIKWKGFGPEENSWEPASNVNAPKLVRAFHQRFPDKPVHIHVRRPFLRGGQCQDRTCPAPAARRFSSRRSKMAVRSSMRSSMRSSVRSSVRMRK
ncbi:uncharacterized protein LOC108647661 [Xenopus tropicalis]|uniref:Gypsy retrotransposon integrase-like protein 1 n=1 Tax=Xenopus tropicalis TaxID=8364 RepID=A0A8J1JL04_XENTR|nr:uncharacterized protein LOC108647661 [Xenopus tropicalis]